MKDIATSLLIVVMYGLCEESKIEQLNFVRFHTVSYQLEMTMELHVLTIQGETCTVWTSNIYLRQGSIWVRTCKQLQGRGEGVDLPAQQHVFHMRRACP